MSYLGRGLDKISNIEILDNITFDGSSSYSITKGSVAFTPNSAQSLLISIDGVVQATNFTVSSSTIDFGVAIPSTSVCNFFLHYGTGVMTVPSDGSVTNAKLGSGSFSNITGVGTLSSGLTLSDNILFDTASKGIYLGTTSATASNLLDDYEEGTWTPICIGSSSTGSVTMNGTYTRGRYTKIGNTVYIHCVVVWSSLTGTGNLEITGIPFTSKNIGSANTVPSSAVLHNNLTISSGDKVVAGISAGDNKIGIFKQVGTSNASTVPVDANGELYFNITYTTDA